MAVAVAVVAAARTNAFRPERVMASRAILMSARGARGAPTPLVPSTRWQREGALWVG